MRYGCCCCVLEKDYGIDYLEKIKLYQEIGFNGMDVLTQDLMRYPIQIAKDVVKAARDADIQLVYNIGASSEHLSYSDNDSECLLYEEDLKRKLDFIGSLGGHHADGSFLEPWPLKCKNNMGKKSQYIEKAIPHIQSVMHSAENSGIVLTLEVLNRFEGFMTNTVREAIDIIEKVGSSNLMITLDVFHSHIEEDSLEDAVTLAGNKLGHVHLGEANRSLPGQGAQINWSAFFSALKGIHYDRMLLIESFIISGGEIAQNIGVWRDLSHGASQSELEDQLAASLLFIRSAYQNA